MKWTDIVAQFIFCWDQSLSEQKWDKGLKIETFISD